MATFRTAILALLVCAFARPAMAACSGSSPNRSAASANRTDVNDCVTAAASGDTVRVPAGTASWSSSISLPANKDLQIIGAGIGSTNITCATCFSINLGASHRISGFTMNGANDGGISTSGEQNLSKHFRIDHNRIVSTSGWAPLELSGGFNAVHPQGLVDNNQFVDVPVHANGTNYQLDEGSQQHVLWAQRWTLGDSSAVVYIEANAFQGTNGNINFADSNYAGRYVFRFNTGTGRGYVEVHSVQGQNRASQRFEIYKNSFSTNAGWPGLAFIRGGSGVVFGNRLTQSGGLIMDNVRSEEDPGGGVGRCNGSSSWDQNTSGQSGWSCRDQIGRAYDNAQWSPGGAYTQALVPAYFWNNLAAGAQFDIDNSGLSTWIRENRDWYTTNTSFNGTTGVGEGPIGSRPGTCTAGVGYWATNEGEWDSTNAGADGRLYKCTATNTWSLYYTPQPYPHPWQTGGGSVPTPPTPAPAAPTNVHIIRALAEWSLLPGIVGLHLLRRRREDDDGDKGRRG